jgi:hypothetical protein
LRDYSWTAPDVSKWQRKTFRGYRRSDGQVGTRNYWVVVPLVFCENRNIGVLKQAFEEELGFAAPQIYRQQVAELARLYKEGRTEDIKSGQTTGKDAGHDARLFLKTWMASDSCCMQAGAAERGKTPTICAG